MPRQVDWIPENEWNTIVTYAPIVSVDLVVETPAGIILGRRTNDPARDEWFVPGGRVRKHEHLEAAVHRIAGEELGVDVEIRERLGVYEHFYEASDVPESGGKHYVPIGYVVETDETAFVADDQHGDLRTFEPGELPELHEYVADYLRDAGLISDA